MRSRRLIAAAALAAVLLAAGCGGSSGSSGSGGSVKQGGVFTIGTTNYIDTLNPFNYIEAEAVTAYLEVYPELVQLAPNLTTYEGSYATSWTHSSDFKTYTYTLHPGGKWSDGKPLTSADVAWTANTIVKYQADATANVANSVAHVSNVTTDGPNKVIFHYDAAVDPNLVLSNISSLYILPEHVWGKYVGSDGKDLKTFRPENNLPLVSGGPFQITKYSKKGTTVFKPNPGYWGAPPHVEAVGLVYYTNSDSMIADLQGGTIDAVDQVPYTAVNARQEDRRAGRQLVQVRRVHEHHLELEPAQAEEPRAAGSAGQEGAVDVRRPAADHLGDLRGQRHARQPERDRTVRHRLAEPGRLRSCTFNCAEGNAMLDQLGYKKGADGIRIAPATTGKYAQPAHPMQYQIMVPNSLDFNGSREFSIVQDGFMNAGVKVTLQAGGDSDAAAAIEYGNNCSAAKGTGYDTFDIALWDWFSYTDPDFQLSVPTRDQWCSWNDQGYDNPAYNAMYKQEGISAGDARKTLVAKMDKLISDQYIYTFLVNEEAISASRPNWAGYHPELNGYNSGYMTEPYQK